MRAPRAVVPAPRRVPPAGLAAAVAVLALAAPGCALRHRPVPVTSHLEHAVPEDASGPVLGVGRFVDARAARSRRGARAPLRLVWHGLVRRGDAQTGDRAFVGDVAEGARLDAAAALARTGAFSEVRLVDDSGGVDLLLVAEIEELVGYQHQDSGISLLRPGFVGHRVGDPLGVARVRYALHGSDRALWEERIETRREVPEAGAAAAALDALSVTNERMAHAVYRRVAGARPVRALPVAVLDACGLGRKRARRVIADASEIMERESALRLEPEVRTWSVVPEPADADELLAAARQVEPPRDGIVVALVALPRPLSELFRSRRLGMARQLGRHAVVGCLAHGSVRRATVVHEIAHLFGAVHVRDRSSIMHPVADFDARFLDLLNRRILRLTRGRPLGRPLPPDLARALHQLYAGAPPAQVDPQDAHAALGALSSAPTR